jgi:hypothetical protein
VVPHIGRHRLAGVEALLDLGVRNVARHDQGPGEREPSAHRVPRELGPHLVHRPAEIHADDLPAERALVHLGKEAGGIGLETLEIHALPGDPAQRLAVRRA